MFLTIVIPTWIKRIIFFTFLLGEVKDSTDQLNEVESELEKVNEKKALLDQLLDDEVEKELDEQKPVNVNPAKCESNLHKIKVCFSIIVRLFHKWGSW